MTEETPEWTEDEIQALLHLVHVPKSGTLTSRIDFAMREMKYYNSNFPVRPMYECREKYYENITKKQTVKETTTMTAKEARQKAELMILSSNAKEFQTIKNKINKAIENGEFKTTIYSTIHPTIIDKLKEDGYTVNEYTGDPQGDNSTTISW